MKLQKLGGVAAVASICAWLIAVFIYSRFGLSIDPIQAMDAYSATPVYSNTSLLLIVSSYILALVFFLALHERMHTDAPYLTRIMLIAFSAATAMGIMEVVVWITGMRMIVPTKDVSAYIALDAIFNGLHTAGGHASAWAVLFTGWAILKTQAFSRILGWLSLAAGILWIPRFMIPQLGSIPWILSCAATIWIGIAMLCQKAPIAIEK